MLRIIRGEYKGRKIESPDNARPVSERAREACFDVLINVVADAVVLDLFAGSGALGFEALSNGAKSCLFVDNTQGGLEVVRENAEHLTVADKCRFCLGDAIDKIRDFGRQKVRFDLVFIDPPYGQGIVNKLLPMVGEYGIVSDFGFLAVFCSIDDEFQQEYGPFKLISHKKYGKTVFLVYEKSDLSGNV
jgi:16S rRNA (guanine966-N2)-methyltransferase